jgi:hypothetical protein
MGNKAWYTDLGIKRKCFLDGIVKYGFKKNFYSFFGFRIIFVAVNEICKSADKTQKYEVGLKAEKVISEFQRKEKVTFSNSSLS